MSTQTSHDLDYIIVGGGTAGLVLAARLTENPALSVCVLEAGEYVSDLAETMVPGLSFRNMGNPKFDWAFSSSPQPTANDRTVHLSRGKGLGGSSTLNFMELSRGHAAEYNAFETLGATGWNWTDLLQYFRKSETFTVVETDRVMFGAKTDASTDGTDGPIHRTMSKWSGNTHVPFQKAVASLGIQFNSNSNGGNNLGVWNANHSIHPVQASRSSSATGYYDPIKSRTNLHVMTNVMATRILFEPDMTTGELTAQGVEYLQDGITLQMLCKKEVVLCAGAFQTPQLLEVSGIGKKDILTSQGITTLVDLPGVGENLQDHFWCPYTTEVADSCDSFEVLQNPTRAAEELEIYQEEKAGMLSTAGSSTFAMLPTTAFAENQSVLRAAVADLKGSGISETAFNIQQSWLFDSSIPQLEIAPFPGFMPAPGKVAEPGKRYFSFFIALLHPFSRGSVHINSSDTTKPPTIDPCMISNNLDLEMIVQAIKFARKLVATEPLASIVKDEVIPGLNMESDEEIKAFIRNTVQTVFHPTGTAAMLPREEMGVVDANLKVYGTRNLRVVDASIIPIQISAHTQSTVYALAEKAADIIKRS